MDFVQQLRSLAERIPKQTERLASQAATSQALVMPFIQALGYNPFDPAETVPQFDVELGNGKTETVDYALVQEDVPIVLIDVKKWDTKLSDLHTSRLYRCFPVADARFAVLTNGIDYRFYSDVGEPNRMDRKPYFTFSMNALDDGVLAEIKSFTKEGFDFGALLDAAERLTAQRDGGGAPAPAAAPALKAAAAAEKVAVAAMAQGPNTADYSESNNLDRLRRAMEQTSDTDKTVPDAALLAVAPPAEPAAPAAPVAAAKPAPPAPSAIMPDPDETDDEAAPDATPPGKVKARIRRPDERATAPEVADEDLKQTVLQMEALDPSKLKASIDAARADSKKKRRTRPLLEPSTSDSGASGADALAREAAARKEKQLKPSVLSRIAAAVRGEATKDKPARAGNTAHDAPAAEAGGAADGNKKKKKKRRGGFSETQWFMEGVKTDADVLEASSDSERYERDEDLSEDERRKYSLRKERED